jgi:hypothetical protein
LEFAICWINNSQSITNPGQYAGVALRILFVPLVINVGGATDTQGIDLGREFKRFAPAVFGTSRFNFSS